MYRNIKSLYCAPGTSTVLQVNYTSKKTKREKKIRFVVTGGGGVRRNWMKVAKKY